MDFKTSKPVVVYYFYSIAENCLEMISIRERVLRDQKPRSGLSTSVGKCYKFVHVMDQGWLVGFQNLEASGLLRSLIHCRNWFLSSFHYRKIRFLRLGQGPQFDSSLYPSQVPCNFSEFLDGETVNLPGNQLILNAATASPRGVWVTLRVLSISSSQRGNRDRFWTQGWVFAFGQHFGICSPFSRSQALIRIKTHRQNTNPTI